MTNSGRDVPTATTVTEIIRSCIPRFAQRRHTLSTVKSAPAATQAAPERNSAASASGLSFLQKAAAGAEKSPVEGVRSRAEPRALCLDFLTASHMFMAMYTAKRAIRTPPSRAVILPLKQAKAHKTPVHISKNTPFTANSLPPAG